MAAYTTILVGTDGSDTSMRAVDRAAAIARDSGARLVIVTAFTPHSERELNQASEELRGESWELVGSAPAEANLGIARDHAAKLGATNIETVAVEGTPIEVLATTAKRVQADLLVVGNVGLNTLQGRLLGSVPGDIARKSPIDVLIVHTV
jgi:nucleotide-binding universal stress UspA family protein